MTGGAGFQALFNTGKRIERPAMIVLWRTAGPEAPRRAGFAVSRQIRGAVARNRAKRRLREAYRATRAAAPEHVDLVVIARPSVLTFPMTVLSKEMQLALSAIPSVPQP